MSEDLGDGRSPAGDVVTITPYRDGPYLVRGPFVVRDQDGNELPTERRTIALCRCGKSSMRPFCDGTHKLVGFRAPSELERWPDES
jgi:CDGSH-type Zn-finger protein